MNEPLNYRGAVVAVVGPTAGGKSALAVALAKQFDGEIVSADSMQVYRGMPIATAQPTVDEQGGVPHHLIGFLDPDTPFSVAKYQALANQTIRDVLGRGKLPILVGGTGLYIDAVVNNTRFLPDAGTGHRAALQKEMEERGAAALLQTLAEIDPQTAAKLHVSDEKRIIRALEVYYETGLTMTQQRAQSHRQPADFRFCLLGLTAQDRQVLYDRIDRRVDRMLADGLLDEARRFFAAGHVPTAKQAIGYKELKPYLDGAEPLESAVERLKRETRRYAKRQLTWFRRNPDIHWLYIDRDTPAQLLDAGGRIINRFLGDTL